MNTYTHNTHILIILWHHILLPHLRGHHLHNLLHIICHSIPLQERVIRYPSADPSQLHSSDTLTHSAHCKVAYYNSKFSRSPLQRHVRSIKINHVPYILHPHLVNGRGALSPWLWRCKMSVGKVRGKTFVKLMESAFLCMGQKCGEAVNGLAV